MNVLIKSLSILFVLFIFILGSGTSSIVKEVNSTSQETSETIEAFRIKIDTIDSEILALLNKRAEAASEIGKLKEKDGLSIYNPEREKIIEEKLKENNPGPMANSSVIKIYREIISACRNIQY